MASISGRQAGARGDEFRALEAPRAQLPAQLPDLPPPPPKTSRVIQWLCGQMRPRAFGASDAGYQHPQAESATLELQQHVWMALQAVRARYRYHRGRLFNANAHGNREGYSLSNADHMQKVDDQFQACVAATKGVLVSPDRTPSWIDINTGKGARLDHLVGLGWSLHAPRE
jgi:hypothetical protein